MDPAQPQECQTLARFPPIPLLPPRINKKKGNDEQADPMLRQDRLDNL